MSTKTLFKLLWVPFVTSVFASCSDKEELPYTPPEETNDSYISPAVPQGNSWPEASMSLTQPFLGAGYDIMGSYIDNNSVKEPVLDLSKIDNEKISNLVGSSGVGDSFIGRDMKEFLRSITKYKKFVVPAENKDDLLFTATITGHTYFQKPYDYSSQYTFAFGSSGANGVIQRLLTLNADWSNWLADDFRQELEDASPETIIELFGTHILVNTHLGYISKTLYRSIVADDEENLLRTANTGMGAHQSSIIKHPNVSIIYPEETVKKNYGGTIVVSLQGADYKVFDQLTGDPMDISPWIQSANEKNRALTTLTGEDLIPIYEVIADPIKKQQIKEAVIAHIKRHQLSLQQTAPIFQASDGHYHRYYTSYKELTAKADICQGVIGSVFVRHEPGTVPLYLSSDGKNHRLTLEPAPNGDGTIIGYVYEKKSDDLNCIYEISDGKNFAYTTEEKDTYGNKGTWKPTGLSFYTKKV